MLDHTLLFDSVREIVIEAIELSTGFLNDSSVFNNLKEKRDIKFSEIDLDSLSKFEIIMAIEERLGLELDADEFGPDDSIDGLTRMLTTRISPDVARTLLP